MSLRSLLPFSTQPSDVTSASASPFASLQREIDRVFSEFGRGWPALGTDLTPRMDIIERNGTIEITAELPGLEEKDVEVTLSDDILTIRGERRQEKEQKDENRHVVERSYGAFSRSVQLPAGVKPEDIRASLSKGLLKVTLPKPVQMEASAKKIEVKAAAA
jgi:HSP20 family protein